MAIPHCDLSLRTECFECIAIAADFQLRQALVRYAALTVS